MAGMNLGELAIQKKVISWMFVLLLGIGGAFSFTRLGRLEFPEFTIDQARIITPYPGASPQQVEEEVTAQLENAAQQLTFLDHVTSITSAGLSQITIEMKEGSAETFAQYWDEMRRRINDAQRALPPGAGPSFIFDDFGDVFGILVSIVGEGYTPADLHNYAKLLRRELVLVPGVKKANIDGAIPERVFVEMSREKMTALGISQERILGLLRSQNVVSNAGDLLIEGESIRIHPTGEFQQVSEMERLIVSSPGSAQLVYLGDIATVSRDYVRKPRKLYHSNGMTALSLGVSFKPGANVVDVGQAVQRRIAELEGERPIGIEIHTVYDQAQIVNNAINDFMINLLEAVGIVFAVLLIAMGLRSGLLMSLVLLLTILGTFIVMAQYGINLQNISLGALIIALGMLVDNAIVVTEGLMIGLKRGLSRVEAAKNVVSQSQWPLLGATLITIIAFAPIGLSPTMTGEFAQSLFYVLLISLSISWVTAVTLTPFFFDMFFAGVEKQDSAVEAEDPYQGIVFTVYKALLRFCLVHRLATISLALACLGGGVFAFSQVKQSFFPASTTPLFLVDCWLPEGTDIYATDAASQIIDKELLELDGVVQVTTVIGGGAQRFMLSYNPEEVYASYAQFIVGTRTLEDVEPLLIKATQLLRDNHPEAEFRLQKLQNGPPTKAAIEARFYGADPVVLRRLASQAYRIVNGVEISQAVRTSWRNRVKVVRPQFLEDIGRRAGITKATLDDALQINFSGRPVGVYRDGTDLIPIVVRAPADERLSANSLHELQIWSAEYATYVPITQVVSDFAITEEDPLILRRDRKRMIAVYAEPLLLSDETADSVLKRVRADAEAIELPPGYSMDWGGLYESSNQAADGIFGPLPVAILAMFLVTVFLFNSVRQAIVIWLTVPFALIGVGCGLLIMGAPFGFFALLGILSLIGMVVKNGIILVEQIKLEAESGDKAQYDAIFDASVSRMRPVTMAALTTMLGMIPLVFNAFFESMAVTIIFGLGFATLLTLIVLPVLYTVFYRMERKPRTQKRRRWRRQKPSVEPLEELTHAL